MGDRWAGNSSCDFRCPSASRPLLLCLAVRDVKTGTRELSGVVEIGVMPLMLRALRGGKWGFHAEYFRSVGGGGGYGGDEGGKDDGGGSGEESGVGVVGRGRMGWCISKGKCRICACVRLGKD